MHTNGIETRDALAERLEDAGIGRRTVYRAFDTAWNGTASARVIAALAQTFAVPIGQLVNEPAGQAIDGTVR